MDMQFNSYCPVFLIWFDPSIMIMAPFSAHIPNCDKPLRIWTTPMASEFLSIIDNYRACVKSLLNVDDNVLYEWWESSSQSSGENPFIVPKSDNLQYVYLPSFFHSFFLSFLTFIYTLITVY